MDDDAVRSQATAFADALVAGNVDDAISSFSQELRRNLGEVLSLFPLPAREATIESFEHAGAGYNVLLRLVGDAEENEVLTRWKVRDGTPTIVEASHQRRTEVEPELETEGSDEPA